MTVQTIQKTVPVFKQLGEVLEAKKLELAKILPKQLTTERLFKVALTVMNRTPGLEQCTLPSLTQAIVQCAELGLEPGGALGHVYLLPYKNNKTNTTDCQVIIGYRGFVELALRSGRVVDIDADVIHAGDTYQVSRGLEPKLKHIPLLVAGAGEVVAAYAVATLANGVKKFTVLRKDEVDRIRARSKASSGGPWVTDYEEMAKKTAVRRLIKLLPLSPEVARAIEHEDEEWLERAPIEMEVAPTRVTQLKGVLAAKRTGAMVVDVLEGETEAEAMARVAGGEPPADVILAGQF